MTLISFCNALLESETDATFFKITDGFGCFFIGLTLFFFIDLDTILLELRN